MEKMLYVSKCGDGLVVHIPEDVAEELGVWEGSPIEVIAEDSKLALKKKRYSLEERVALITEENRHSEIDFGPPRGREVW